MPAALLRDAFRHHVWATTRVLDACADLSPEQLSTVAPGTYGSILDTLRHVVGADSWYLFDLTGDAARRVEEGGMGPADLRAVMEADGRAWDAYLDADPDPDELVREVDEDDGFERDAPVGIRLAQALHHGTDHRSQVCTALTSLGIEPPPIDVWDFGTTDGRVIDLP
ncbi:MAG TPA: DinB family protein [Actinomycetota bacterium]